ncbi:hypothetical protein B0H14DRAFT_1138567 [Mycena olivaceomarginata]|nr:hypothetical protein B0H14DRAFT_1138567 [Mycena olivaceomarginata]
MHRVWSRDWMGEWARFLSPNRDLSFSADVSFIFSVCFVHGVAPTSFFTPSSSPPTSRSRRLGEHERGSTAARRRRARRSSSSLSAPLRRPDRWVLPWRILIKDVIFRGGGAHQRAFFFFFGSDMTRGRFGAADAAASALRRADWRVGDDADLGSCSTSRGEIRHHPSYRCSCRPTSLGSSGRVRDQTTAASCSRAAAERANSVTCAGLLNSMANMRFTHCDGHRRRTTCPFTCSSANSPCYRTFRKNP